MTDLRRILPRFPVHNFASLIPAIEHNVLTTTDLLTLHPADIAKQTRLPILDVKRLIAAISASLSDDLKFETLSSFSTKEEQGEETGEGNENVSGIPCISTLVDDLDVALGGGIPIGRITEFAGESGAGKTQFLLGLCLAVQLPPPRGLGKQALYISTESGLSTSRLAQMLKDNEILKRVDFIDQPSLDNILSTSLSDLESQDHILQYQVPVLLERHDVGLIVLDSVAANYRAEFERQGTHGSNMAARSSDLVKLGALLRDMARRHNLAVVVANQVADRFSSSAPFYRPRPSPATQDTPLASRTKPPPESFPGTPASPLPFCHPDDDNGPPTPPVLLLDHQQRWFTGWGDDPHSPNLKTPSLGLVWTTQIACRIALFKQPVYGRSRTVAPAMTGKDDDSDPDTNEPTLRNWRRWMKVVFAPHTEASGPGVEGAVEFKITSGGLKAVPRIAKSQDNL